MRTQDILFRKDAVEEFICAPMKKLQPVEMSRTLTELFVRSALSPGRAERPTFSSKEQEQKEIPPIILIIENRLRNYHTFTIPDFRVIVILAMAAGTPGNAVLYLAYMQKWCKDHGVHKIGFREFSERIFPMGFFSDPDMQMIWDGQKLDDGSNLIDRPDAMDSIQLERPLK